jgi:hypothetical protein
MFLLNSRNPLVTATYRAKFPKRRRHPLYQRYGANLPNSLAKIVPDTPWASHPEHQCWFWVRTRRIPPNDLFMGSRVQLNASNETLFLFSSGSHHYGTPQSYAVKQSDNSVQPSPNRQPLGFESPRVPPWHWNVNQFPFRAVMLTLHLGSANSRLTTHCRETLALSAIGILTRLSCYYHRDLQSLHGPQDLTALLPPMRDALLPHY